MIAAEPVKAAITTQTSPRTTPVRVIPDEKDQASVNAKASSAIGSARATVSGTWTEFVTDIREGGVGAIWQGKWRMPVVGATVLVVVLVALGTVYWVHRARASNNPVKAAETTAAVTPSNPASSVNAQPAISTDAVSAASASGVKPQADKQAKPKDQPKDQNAAAKPPQPAASQPATQPVSAVDAALRLPQPVPKSNAPANREIAKEEPSAPNGATGVAGSVPGGLPASSVINVVKDLSAAEPKMANQKVTVSSGVAQGMLVHRVAPQYPAQAKEARLQGTVVLQAVIGKDGSITSVHALRGNPVLSQAAIDAVKQWRYKPYALNGEPVEADTQISVTFSPDH